MQTPMAAAGGRRFVARFGTSPDGSATSSGGRRPKASKGPNRSRGIVS